MRTRSILSKGMALSVAIVLIFGLVLGPLSQPATGQAIVNDPPHTLQTIVHYIARAYEIYQKAQQIRRQIESIQRQVQALKKLANPNWREVASLLFVLDSLIGQGQALAYSLADIDAQFQSTFPGWVARTDWKSEHRRQLERTLETMRRGLNSVNRASRLITDQYTLGDIKQTMTRIQGHQEALELLATIGTFAAEEQILTRQALAVQTNLSSVYYGYRLNEEAQAAATHLDMLERTATAARARHSPGFTFRPSTLPF